MDSVDTTAVTADRLKNLQDAADAIKRSQDALKGLAEAADVIKRARGVLKELGNSVRLEIDLLSGHGITTGTSVAHQRLRAITPITSPMVVCSQIQRSGGTLFTRLFDGHPACFVHPSELKWGWPKKWRWPEMDLSAPRSPDALLDEMDEGWPKRYALEGYHKYSTWTHERHPEDIQRYPFVFDAELQRRIFATVLAERGAATQRDVLNAYLTALFNAWLDYQNLYAGPKQWVAAFMPRLTMQTGGCERFFADYPDGLIVTIVREPSAWLASFSRHMGEDDPEQQLDLWVQSADASVRAHDERPERVIVVLFEDLVHETEAVMRRLCERMGIAFTDAVLQPTYNSMPVLSDSSHELATGIDPAVTERHARTLTATHLDVVTRKAAPLFAEIRRRFSIRSS